MDFTKLIPFRRQLRPVDPASLPIYLDQELERVAMVTVNYHQALTELEARIAALEP